MFGLFSLRYVGARFFKILLALCWILVSHEEPESNRNAVVGQWLHLLQSDSVSLVPQSNAPDVQFRQVTRVCQQLKSDKKSLLISSLLEKFPKVRTSYTSARNVLSCSLQIFKRPHRIATC